MHIVRVVISAILGIKNRNHAEVDGMAEGVLVIPLQPAVMDGAVMAQVVR